MWLYEKINLVLRAAHEFANNKIDWYEWYPPDRRATFYITELKNPTIPMPPEEVIIQFITEKLEGCGLAHLVDFWTQSLWQPDRERAPVEGLDGLAAKISFNFKDKPVMGTGADIGSCKGLLDNGSWAHGINVARASKSTKYKIGQQVIPTGVDPWKSRYKWHFVTSYRAPSTIGAFRLLRSDGQLTSTGTIYPAQADVDYKDETQKRFPLHLEKYSDPK